MAFQFWIRLNQIRCNFQRSKTGDHDTDAITFQVFKNGSVVGQGGMVDISSSGTVFEFPNPGGALLGPNPMGPATKAGLINDGWIIGPLDVVATDTITVCYTATNLGDGFLSQSEKDVDQLTEKLFDGFYYWLFGEATGGVGFVVGVADLLKNISDYTDKLPVLPDEAKFVIKLITSPVETLLGVPDPALCNGTVFAGSSTFTGSQLAALDFSRPNKARQVPIPAASEFELVTDPLTDAPTHSSQCGHEAESVVAFSVFCNHTPIGMPAHCGGDLVQSSWGATGNFELLVPSGAAVRHFAKNNDEPSSPWVQVHTFGYAASPSQFHGLPMMVGHPSMIQSQYLGDGLHGNFEVVLSARPVNGVVEPHVDHWWMDSGSGTWHGPEPVITAEGETVLALGGDPVMLQSNWGVAGNFELLVPNGSRVRHYARDNDNGAAPWHFQHEFGYAAPDTVAGATFIQSRYRSDGLHGNFEAVLRVSDGDGTPSRLDHWWFDSARMAWIGPINITEGTKPVIGATADPALLQSDRGQAGNFELLVPIGSRIHHYARNNDANPPSWALVREFGYGRDRFVRHVSFIAMRNSKGDGIHADFAALVRSQVFGQPETHDLWRFSSRTGSWAGPEHVIAGGVSV
ncbi:hypothetical protein [Rhizobium freirei]|nr:hypothetical protein [Rhizobium freirei]